MTDQKKVITVGKLKKLLAGIPDDFYVKVDGCDCIGPATGIEVIREGPPGEVLIVRQVDDAEEWQ